MRKSISKSRKGILIEEIDYLDVDSVTYRNLYIFYSYYCPEKLENPYFLYLLLNTYKYQLFTMWEQIEEKYGSFARCPKDQQIFQRHMYERLERIYREYNPRKLDDSYFIYSLLKQYYEEEHLLIGKVLELYSGTEKLRIGVSNPNSKPCVPPRPEGHVPLTIRVDNPVCKPSQPQEAIRVAAAVAKLAADDAKKSSLRAVIAPEMYSITEMQSHVPEKDEDSIIDLENPKERGESSQDDWDYVDPETSDGFSV